MFLETQRIFHKESPTSFSFISLCGQPTKWWHHNPLQDPKQNQDAEGKEIPFSELLYPQQLLI